ncbi:MAG: PH domain-containing protein [Thermoguttaceae bacterium]
MNESIHPLPGASTDDSQIFVSKRDTWLVVIYRVGTFFAVSSALLLLLLHPEPTWLPLSLSMLLLVVSVFMVWTFNTTSYRIAGGTLDIRYGPFRKRIELEKVEKVTPCRDGLSSPALSLDRLRIVYQGSMMGVLISPLDRNSFLDCCVSHCKHLRREGDRLVRAE